MNKEASPIDSYLYNIENERILWNGRPRKGFYLNYYDIYMIPFSLLWGITFSIIEFIVISTKADFGLILISTIFLLISIYLMFGRFFFDYIVRKSVFYGLTKDRILIYNNLSKKITKIKISNIKFISLFEKGNNYGTITFELKKRGFHICSGNLEWFFICYNITPKFEMIENAKLVYDKIIDIREHRIFY